MELFHAFCRDNLGKKRHRAASFERPEKSAYCQKRVIDCSQTVWSDDQRFGFNGFNAGDSSDEVYKRVAFTQWCEEATSTFDEKGCIFDLRFSIFDFRRGRDYRANAPNYIVH